MMLRIADAADPAGRPLAVLSAAGRDLLLVRAEGGPYLCERRCPHAGGDLAAGRLEGDVLVCRNHGLRFRLADGRVDTAGLDEDLLESLDPAFLERCRLRLFPVEERGDGLFAEL